MTSKQILMSRKVASQDKIGQPKDRSGNGSSSISREFCDCEGGG